MAVLEQDLPGSETSPKREQAESIVNQYAAWSAAAGFIPIPIIDLGAITLLQVNMVKSLHRLYEPRIKFDKDRAKAWVSGLLGSSGALILAVPAGSLIKAIPVVGTIAGMITEPAIAAGATYTVGHIFINYFERGGKFSEFDPRKWEDALAEVKKNTETTNANVERLLQHEKPVVATSTTGGVQN